MGVGVFIPVSAAVGVGVGVFWCGRVCAYLRAWLWARQLVHLGVGLGLGVCGRGRVCGVQFYFLFLVF